MHAPALRSGRVTMLLNIPLLPNPNRFQLFLQHFPRAYPILGVLHVLCPTFPEIFVLRRRRALGQLAQRQQVRRAVLSERGAFCAAERHARRRRDRQVRWTKWRTTKALLFARNSAMSLGSLSRPSSLSLSFALDLIILLSSQILASLLHQPFSRPNT
eukprot:6212769-Pleurochrysis_carterae.AAC.2